MEDSNLIETPAAFWENTYRQNINKMIGVGYRYTVNRQVAEDLAHDAFMIAYEKVGSFKGEGPFEAWLRRIVVNVCLQYIREQNKKKYLNDWLQNETATEEMDEENLKKEKTDFTKEELLDVINLLPEHHKLVFNLYVIDKFTHAEIGKELGISEGTSKSHLARARKKIRLLLNEKQAIKKKEQKKIVFFFLFRRVDSIYQQQFKNFELSSHQDFSRDFFSTTPGTAPAIKASILVGKFSSFVAASMLTATAILCFILWQKNKQDEVIAEKRKIYPGNTATISKNAIMLNENNVLNKKSGDMKNLKTIGAILLTGTSLAMPVNAQVPVKVTKKIIEPNPKSSLNVQVKNKKTVTVNPQNEIKVNANPNVNAEINSNINVQANIDITGTFYGEKLRWSTEDNELHFDGKSVINFGKNNYINNGTTSFLGKVYYLVVDGKPIATEGKARKAIELSEKKYNLTQLSTATAMKKYGEAGKNGAVEISLAE